MSPAHSSSTESTTEPRIHIYIDNSNVFIEGSKIYSENSQNDPKVDFSWRYDVTRLRDVLCNKSKLQYNRTVDTDIHTTLYGSTPPPGDIWLAMEAKDVTVRVFDRSAWTGKEKQVDTKMTLDIGVQAARDQMNGLQSEFIVVTGDEDYLPSIKLINECGFHAHVWSWSKAFSRAFKEEFNKKGQQILFLYNLDKFKDDFTFQKKEATQKKEVADTRCSWRLYCPNGLQCKYLHPADERAFFILNDGPKDIWRSKACAYGKYCTEYANCKFKHSKDEEKYFAQNGGPKPPYKTKPCRYGEHCDHRYNCIYYHNENEQVCPTCDQMGKRHGKVGSEEWNKAHASNLDVLDFATNNNIDYSKKRKRDLWEEQEKRMLGRDLVHEIVLRDLAPSY